MSNIYNEWQKVIAEINQSDSQRRLKLWRGITDEALPAANQTLRDMLKPPSKGIVGAVKRVYSNAPVSTKMSAFVEDAQERNPNILTNLQRSWNPISVYRHDPKNLRVTYEVSQPSMQILGDQLSKVSDTAIDATMDAISEDKKGFLADLIQGVVDGRITKVDWEGGD